MIEILEKIKLKIGLVATRLYQRHHIKLLVPLFTAKNERIQALLDKSARIARSKGLRFTSPSIRLINPGIGEMLRHRRGNEILGLYRTLGQATRDGKFIFIFNRALKEHNEMELAVIIAHELGHIIDFQTNRMGHPLFDNIGHLNEEMFAHAIAAYIHSRLVVMSVLRTCNIPINEAQFLWLNLDC